MPDMSVVASTRQALRRWLEAGEIVSPSGAYYAWYDLSSEEPSFEYPEITGYALTHLASQPDITAGERATAARAAAWLVSRWRDGDRSARSGWDDGRVYYFDLAMEANGLLLAGSRFDMPDASDIGREIVEALCAEVEGSGYLPALPGGFSGSRRGWSTEGVPHMGKALQCALHARVLFPGTGDALQELVDALVIQTVKHQDFDGRFVTDPSDEVTMLHPHLYAVEGLWCHAQATGSVTSAEAAAAGAAWVWAHQLPSGGLPRYVEVAAGGAQPPEQLDLTAQAVRAAFLTNTNESDAARAAQRLVELAVPRANGASALSYQPLSGDSHLNAWVTLFAVQALRVASGEPLAWQELV